MITTKEIQALKPKAKNFRVACGQSLFVEVTPPGGKLFRFRFRFGGKEKMLAIGQFPAMGLAEARKLAAEARELLQSGKDPAAVRRNSKERASLGAANTFKVVCLEWHGKMKVQLAAKTIIRHESAMNIHMFPMIGDTPIGELTTPDMLRMLRKIEAKGSMDMCGRVWNLCGRVFRYGVAHGYCTRDIELKDIIHKPPVKHHSALLDPAEVGAALRAFDTFAGTMVVKTAMQMLPHVAVRPGELRQAEWADVNLDTAEWRYRMSKVGTNHIVPLTPQVVELFRNLQPLTGGGKYVFPSERTTGRAMSDNAICAAYRRLGFGKEEIVAHGWRSTFRTLAAEELGQRDDLLEFQLGHTVKGPLGAAYNRTTFLPERREMMVRWSNYLDSLK